MFSFSLLTFLLNCEPEVASSRFDSGVSILAAAFVRPDEWVQGPLVVQWPSSPALDARMQGLYGTVLYGGGHEEDMTARAVRHGSSAELQWW